MAINLRSSREIDLLAEAGKVVAEVLSKLKQRIEPGVTTAELDDYAAQVTEDAGGIALFRGVKSPFARRPFPGVICASVNDELVHGIPSDKVKLKEGDIISVDYGVKLNGYCSDAAFTKAVGKVDGQTLKLMDVTKGMLEKAIEMARPGLKWSEIAGEMEAMARDSGFSVVKDFVGHGIGTEMHEDPKVPNYVSNDLKRNDIFLKEGMMLAIEPMVNSGSSKVKTLKDGWTVVTADGSNCAHYEHTIAIVDGGCRVMTG